MKYLFILASICMAMMSCGEKPQERTIKYVTLAKETDYPSDTLILELESILQQYASILSRSEQGEAVDAHLRAIMALKADFDMKISMLVSDMDVDEAQHFDSLYNDCYKRIGLGRVSDYTEPAEEAY